MDFSLEKYIEEKERIYNEDEAIYLANYKELNKKYNIIFDYYLGDELGIPKNRIIIFDKGKDNLITIDYDNSIEKHTISSEDLNSIKESINKNNYIFTDGKVALAPILDGTTHTINVMSDNKFNSIETFNLWYWYFEKDVMKTDASEEEKKYTKSIIDLIDDIEEVLEKYNVYIQLDYDEE